MIPLARPSITDKDVEAVVEVLRSGWLIHGPKNEEFEKEFVKYIGTKYAISMNSCASALHASLLANDIKDSDEVIAPSFTHVATANCIVTNNAKPVFVDIDLETFNIDPEKIEEKINEKTKAIIPVHFAGLSCDMKKIMEIAEKNNLLVVEDVAEACGAEYNGRKLGSFGIGCFSFFPIKNMTTGEGGMVTTDDERIYNEIYSIMGHGMDKSAWARSYSKYPWERIQRTIGFNFRLTNFQAALGVEQLKRLDEMNEKRRRNAKKLSKGLEEFDCITPQKVSKNCTHSYQMYTARIEGIDRNLFLTKLRDGGIGASVHFNPPVHLQPFYMENFNTKEKMLPITEKVSKTIFTLPMHPGLTDNEIDKILISIEETLKKLK